MDLAARLQQLEDMIREAKSMPLSSSALLNREEVLELVAELKEALPEEIKQARWVVKDREELLTKGRRDSQRIVEEAEQEQLRMATREEVVKRAEAEADRILAEAREEAGQPILMLPWASTTPPTATRRMNRPRSTFTGLPSVRPLHGHRHVRGSVAGATIS